MNAQPNAKDFADETFPASVQRNLDAGMSVAEIARRHDTPIISIRFVAELLRQSGAPAQ